jgi:hypothetical protein
MKSTSVFRRGADVLQHAHISFAVCSFRDHAAGIAVQSDTESLGDRFSLSKQHFVKCGRLWKAGRCTVMKLGERSYRVGGTIENQLGPLRTTSILKGDSSQSCTGENGGSYSTFG